MDMNLPNQLTLFRIGLIPVFVISAIGPFDLGTWQLFKSTISIQWSIAMMIFMVASMTDFLDGYLARKLDIATNFGRFADPLADKMLVMTAFIILVELDLAPAWLVSIIVCRELAVTGLRLILVEQGGTVLSAAWSGKLKTVTQMTAISLLLIDNFPFKGIGVPFDQWMLYACLGLTIYSGVDYFWNARHILLK